MHTLERSAAPASRLKLIIAYDGQPFRGWQSQAGGNTVQDHLEMAFRTILGVPASVQGSGRTDAGVHALAQCAHADVPHTRLNPGGWLGALNANLPREIRVLRCTEVPSDFHARFAAKGKIYRYRIWNDETHMPLEIGRSWHLFRKLDRECLVACAGLLTGTHDFASFAANRGHKPRDTVRTILRISVASKGPLITLTFRGSGFLYKMVRLMTGTMARCAEGRAEAGWIEALLAGSATKTSFAAPAEGLYLVRVLY